MAAPLASKRRNFAGDWTCSICLELPLKPFQAPCGHCMCAACARKLPVSEGGQRKCPTCSVAFSDVLKQPQLARTLEDLASMLWPDAWGFWEELRGIHVGCDVLIFDLIARFVESADEDNLAALRLLRFSKRWGHKGNKYRSLFMEPLLTVEAGGKWDGYGSWLTRVMDRGDTDDSFLFMSVAGAAESAHRTAAPRLIPLLARVTSESEWADAIILQAFSRFAQAHIGCLEGGWASLVDAKGFTTIAPVKEIAALFAASPSARLLSLLTAAMTAQFVEWDDAEPDAEAAAALKETACALDAVVGTVAVAFPSPGSAAGAAFDVAIVRFASALCSLLPPQQAAELLRRHACFKGLWSAPEAAASGGDASEPAATESEPESGAGAAAGSRKRGRQS